MSRMYPPWGDGHRSDSIIGSGRGNGDMDGAILEAVERAKGFKLCLRRIWALSSSLPGGASNLPSLIPAVDMFSAPSQKLQHHEHEQCTFDFCEHSRLDFTSVEQHHENCETNGSCKRFEFPLGQLDDRVELESVTAWKLVSESLDDALSLIDSKQPYMAVSHVWADGTGAGTWGPGKVNRCLYRFFCDVAREFQCEGCWWDTISIPRTDELRNKALNNMHTNYANARVTLVHDLYLREWEWVDAETACFAIVMSPWYSRGWTALELAKSHKVKILFKARNDRYVIKDLDVDILAEVPQSSPHYATAKAILTLRTAKIHSFGDLSSILVPRDTSKPRDIPIISGLLAGVDVSGQLSQQEIYQRILRKLGKVAQGHLFHSSATMAAPGFSWCPTNILDMPRTETDSKTVWLDLQENGDLEGKWKVYSTDHVKDRDLVWHGTHALTRAFLKSALGEEVRKECLLLAENARNECTRALLVQPMHCEGQPTDVVYCRFVGPVYFHSALGSREDSHNDLGLEGQVLKVRITNNDKMRKLDREAWKFVHDTFEASKTPEETEAPRVDSAAAESMDYDDFGRQNMKALLFLETNTAATRKELFEPPKFQPTSQFKLSDGMVANCTLENNNKSASIKAFFYGHENFVGKIKDWLGKSIVEAEESIKVEETVKTGELMHLSLERNRVTQVDAFATELYLDGKALQLAVENGNNPMALPLVSLLLNNGVSPVFKHKGQSPMYSATCKNETDTMKWLLTNSIYPVKTDEDQNEMHSGLHLAAAKDFVDIAREFVEHMEGDLNVYGRDGRTALVVAIQKGHFDIVQLLLDNDASTSKRDNKQHTPLHYAALKDDEKYVKALLSHAKTQCQKEEESEASGSASASDTNSDTDSNSENESSADAGNNGDGDRYKPPVEIGTEQMHARFAQKANLDSINNEGKTALQLASQQGNWQVIDLLLKHGSSTSVSKSPGETALALAAMNGRVEAVKILLPEQPDEEQPVEEKPDEEKPDEEKSDEEKPDEEQPDEEKPDEEKPDEEKPDGEKPDMWKQSELDTALLLAVSKLSDGGDAVLLKQVIELLTQHGARPGLEDAYGMTALHWATRFKDESVATSLLDIMQQKDDNLEIKSKKEQQSALVMAAFLGRKLVVKELLKRGADIKSKDSRDRTALHWAAIQMEVEIAKDLVGTGDEDILQCQDAQNHTALHLAAERGELDLTKFLIEAAGAKVGAIVSRSDSNGRCALILAASSRQRNVVEILLGNGSDPLRDDDSGKSALGWAAMKGFDDVVKDILLHPATTLKDQAIEKALKLASDEGHLQISTMLLEKIKDPRLRDSLVYTVLFSPAALTRTSTPATERLMQLVGDPNRQDENGQTALMFAVQNGKRFLVEMLLELKADPDKPDRKKRTPLMIAAQKNDYSSISYLLRANANIDMQDDRNYTALHYAADYGHMYTTARLIRGNFQMDTNLQDFRGRTALHIVLEKFGTYLYGNTSSNFYSDAYLDSELMEIALRRLLMYGARLDIQDVEKQTPLHWAVRRNKLDLVRLLLKYKGDEPRLDIPDVEERTPLLLAAERGYSEIVGQLLMKDDLFDPDKRDKKGRTALLLAAERGDEISVGFLLDKKANPNIEDHKSRTALMRAAQNGHVTIVTHLTHMGDAEARYHRRENVFLDARDDMGRTALMLAAESGHSQIVTNLQDKGADSSLIDYEGKKAWQRAMDKGHADIVDSLLSTPDAPNQDMTAVNEALLVASRRGWTQLVGVLLDHEADVTFQHEEGTALHMAAMGGHFQVVEKLLEKDIGIVAQDQKKRTALMLATEHGFASIVELLLKKKEVKVEINDWMGPEALRCAAEKDNRGIVQQLLAAKIYPNDRDSAGRTALDPNGRDSAGRTALTLAASNGNQEIVDLLLKEKADPNSKDKQNKTALHHAAWGGHDGVVKSLLLHNADVNTVDDSKQSPLHLAAERASDRVVELLLGKGVNLNARSKDGQTPLHRAAWGGSHDIVKLLRKWGADSFLQDSSNNKPWQVAAEKGFECIVETLLKEEGNIRDELISQQKALIFASHKGYVTMVKALLDKGADSMVTDKDGLTPLHWASKRGDHNMVSLLIDRGDLTMKLDAVDEHRKTPLCLAVQEGRAAVVRILLEKGANPNIVGQEGRTVLHIAANENSREIVQILNDHKIDPHIRDDRKQKAWLLAAKAGHYHIARLLFEREVDFNPQSQKIEELFLELAAKGFVPMVDLLLDKGVDKDAVDRLGRSAMAIAAKQGKGDVVKLLLSVGANPGTPDSNFQTPLLWAAKTGNQRIMNMLLDMMNGMDESKTRDRTAMLNHRDSKARTALLIALKNKHDEVAKLLLEKGSKGGIDLNLGDSTGKTALHYAAETGSDDILRLLLDKSAERTFQDALGRTPLLLAADCDRETTVGVLLESWDQAINIADLHKRTVLHVVAERGNSKLTSMLLGHGADRDCSDDLGRTALSLAVENGHYEVVKLLLAKKAKRDLPGIDKRTPLSLAVANGDRSIVEALLEESKAEKRATNMSGRSLLQLAVQSGNRDVTWLVAEQMMKDPTPRKDAMIQTSGQDIPVSTDEENQ